MRLLYMWVVSPNNSSESYKCNFTTDYDIEFDELESEVAIKKKTTSIDYLLYGSNINVSLIIGENGSGKSTILEFIRRILFENYLQNPRSRGFIIWEEEEKIWLNSSKGNKVIIDSDIEVVKSKYSYEKYLLLYYSDLLDNKTFGEYIDKEQAGKAFDISTSYMLRMCQGSMNQYFHKDIKRQIIFYSKIKKEEKIIPFKSPGELGIKIHILSIDIFQDILDEYLEQYEYNGKHPKGGIQTKSYTIGLLKCLENIYKDEKRQHFGAISIEQIFMWNIFLVYIHKLLEKRREADESDYDEYESVDESLKKLLKIEEPKEEFTWEQLDEIFTNGEETTETTFYDYREFYHKVKVCKKSIDDKNKIANKLTQSDVQLNIKIRNTEIIYIGGEGKWQGNIELKEFQRLFSEYENLTSGVDFIELDWGMSSGEYSMFTLFARLDEVMCKKDNSLIRSAILLLDEIDTLYHPRWQQEIMKKLTDFIHKNYNNTVFQIIITTHSPILLSDIPRENVIFLRKGEENKEDKSVNKKETFAANIATLYYNSFLLQEGSIGEIAKKCINSLLDTIAEFKQGDLVNPKTRRQFVEKFLEKQGVTDIRNISVENVLKDIKKLISSIGEDIWRYQVEKQFLELGSEKENPSDRIMKDIEELKQLEGKEAVEALIKRIQERD